MPPFFSRFVSPLWSRISRLPSAGPRVFLPGGEARPAVTCETLHAGQPARLRLRPGETLLVRQGRLWLTREGDLVDHVLSPGCGHVAAGHQEVVIEAFGAPLCCYERHSLKGM